jgi:hypothetical protein
VVILSRTLLLIKGLSSSVVVLGTCQSGADCIDRYALAVKLMIAGMRTALHGVQLD